MGESITGLKRSHMCCHVNETMIGQEVTGGYSVAVTWVS